MSTCGYRLTNGRRNIIDKDKTTPVIFLDFSDLYIKLEKEEKAGLGLPQTKCRRPIFYCPRARRVDFLMFSPCTGSETPETILCDKTVHRNTSKYSLETFYRQI